jgi:L-ascorbate metabolism protein UlaG (beta-lactamase superfamily)
MAEIALAHTHLLEEVAQTETRPGSAAFWWMGQHTFLVKAGGKVFYFDPWFANWESRQTPSLLTPQEAKHADFALITHGHGDHLCPETLPDMALASPNALFLCPKTEAGRVMGEGKVPQGRVHPMTDGDVFESEGVRITAIKSKHEFFEEIPGVGFPYLGYVVEAGGVTFYHSGDCIMYEGLMTALRQWEHFDALFLPINGRDAERFQRGCLGNFTYQEAAEIAGELEAGLVVPSHYDMFIGNQEDPAKFVRFLNAKYPNTPSWVGKAGQRVFFPPKPL